MNNILFNINNNNYNEYLNDTNKFNNYIANKLRNTIRNIFTINALNYDTNYIKEIIKFSSIIFNNLKKYKLVFEILDKRKYNIKNNEYIFITNILCFKYIIKIISDSKNGFKSSLNEIYNSIFIKHNFILTDVCPHFTYLITYIPINKKFNEIDLRSSINYGLIFDYINPWIINESLKITSLEYLLANISKLKEIFSINYINKVLYNIFFQIFYSICVFSKFRINHNDLRPSNILIHGNYDNLNTYDKYTIIIDDKITDYYLLNLGFKVKIIDFGLTNSDMIDKLNNQKALTHELSNEAGIFKLYSEFYDIHYIINDILCRIKRNDLTDEFYDFIISIIDNKYISSNNKNIYINEFFRLGFPFTIKEYVELNSLEINLTYDNDKLIINQDLLNNLIINIKKIIKCNPFECIINNLKDPIDNNRDKLKNPLEVIKLFDKIMIKNEDLSIMNNYYLDFTNNNYNLDNIS